MTNGTATVWAAAVPQSLTVVSGAEYVDAGEHLFLKKLEAGGSDDLAANGRVWIEYVDGVVTTG